MLSNSITDERKVKQIFELDILEDASMPFNKALIVGRLRSKFKYSYTTREKERFCQASVSVLRKSGERDTITVIAPEKLVKNWIEQPIRGKYIKAIGAFCSHLHKLEQEGKKNWLQLFLLAEEVEIYDEKPAYEFNNCVFLEGRVNKPPFFKKSTFDRNITELFITVRRDDNRRLDYIPCITWGDLAYEAKKVQVGDTITIKGRIQSRQYFDNSRENPDIGVYREVHEVSVFEIVKVVRADTQ